MGRGIRRAQVHRKAALSQLAGDGCRDGRLAHTALPHGHDDPSPRLRQLDHKIRKASGVDPQRRPVFAVRCRRLLRPPLMEESSQPFDAEQIVGLKVDTRHRYAAQPTLELLQRFPVPPFHRKSETVFAMPGAEESVQNQTLVDDAQAAQFGACALRLPQRGLLGPAHEDQGGSFSVGKRLQCGRIDRPLLLQAGQGPEA
jgi:hypothetical protein